MAYVSKRRYGKVYQFLFKKSKIKENMPILQHFYATCWENLFPLKIFVGLSILMYYLISCNKLFVLFNALNTINIQHFVFLLDPLKN